MLKKSYCIEYIRYLKSYTCLKIYNATEAIVNQLHTPNQFNNIYTEKGFGGHLNFAGNAMISKWIMDKIECKK